MRTKRGQSIVEVVIAAALISVGIIAALSLANYSQKQTASAKNLGAANRYNDQAADWLREQKNLLGWETLAAKASQDDVANHAIYCLYDLPRAPDTFTDLTPGACAADKYIPGTQFVRELNIDTTSQASGSLKFTLTNAWKEATTHSITSEFKLLQ